MKAYPGEGEFSCCPGTGNSLQEEVLKENNKIDHGRHCISGYYLIVHMPNLIICIITHQK
jgi:hypothetical protein